MTNTRPTNGSSPYAHYFSPETLKRVLQTGGAAANTIAGVQRYDVRHLVRWTDLRAPDLKTDYILGRSELLNRLEAVYRHDRETRLTSDTLIATAVKQ